LNSRDKMSLNSHIESVIARVDSNSHQTVLSTALANSRSDSHCAVVVNSHKQIIVQKSHRGGEEATERTRVGGGAGH